MKKVLILAVAGLMAVAAKADYSGVSLYWNVGGSEIAANFTYAMLKYTLNSDIGYMTVATPAGDKSKVKATDGSTGSFFSNLGGKEDWAGYSFIAEAYNADGLVGMSDSVLFGDLVDAYALYTDMGTATPYSFKITTAVPEPTSGLLLLLGVAGLALRRKRGRDVPVASGNTRGRDVPVASI